MDALINRCAHGVARSPQPRVGPAGESSPGRCRNIFAMHGENRAADRCSQRNQFASLSITLNLLQVAGRASFHFLSTHPVCSKWTGQPNEVVPGRIVQGRRNILVTSAADLRPNRFRDGFRHNASKVNPMTLSLFLLDVRFYCLFSFISGLRSLTSAFDQGLFPTFLFFYV